MVDFKLFCYKVVIEHYLTNVAQKQMRSGVAFNEFIIYQERS